MFTYTTIFIGSLIVAVIALVIHKVAMSTTRSTLSSKGPLSITSSATNTRTGHAAAGTAAWPSERVHAAPLNEVREPQPRQATGAVNSSHCSLYDADPTAPPTDLSDAWPHRKEKLEVGGKSYKVTRKVHPKL